jgi:hypothetical protein
MAAPPKITAVEMRGIQSAKSAVYLASLEAAAKPFTDRLFLKLEGRLQVAKEDFRPTDSVTDRILWGTEGVIDPLDLDAFFQVVTSATAREYAPPRSFTVSTAPVLDTQNRKIGIDVTLFWR